MFFGYFVVKGVLNVYLCMWVGVGDECTFSCGCVQVCMYVESLG